MRTPAVSAGSQRSRPVVPRDGATGSVLRGHAATPTQRIRSFDKMLTGNHDIGVDY